MGHPSVTRLVAEKPCCAESYVEGPSGRDESMDVDGHPNDGTGTRPVDGKESPERAFEEWPSGPAGAATAINRSWKIMDDEAAALG